MENFDTKIDPKEYENSGNYEFLSILGIQDEIQDNVSETISYLKPKVKIYLFVQVIEKKQLCIFQIELGLLMVNTFFFDENIKTDEISNKTFVFSSLDILKSLKDYEYLKKFKKYLLYSKNFVSYSLIPKDKQYIVSLFRSNDSNIIAVGDGTNDIPMLNSATVAVSINNGLNNNVINNSHMSIRNFKNLVKCEYDISNCVNINLRTAFLVYYKTLLVNSLIYFFIIYNQMDFRNLLFSFF